MSAVNARILIWGIAGCGKSTTLRTIHAKLRGDLRGEIEQKPTRLDPTVSYESLAIRLGEVGGVGTEIEIIAVPSAPEEAMTRKQLLDEVDGIILSLDCSKERLEANIASIDELRASLAAYGHRLDAFPLVIQYNKRDIADPFAIEDLHRRIGLPDAAVFETIAKTGHGILATLTTISKNVVRSRRGGTTGSDLAQVASAQAAQPVAASSSASPENEATEVEAPELEASLLNEEVALDSAPLFESEALRSSPHDFLEAAILAEADELGSEDLANSIEFDFSDGTQPDWHAVTADAMKPEAGLGGELRIVSVGQASVELDGGVRLPLVLGDEAGQTRTVVLSLRLDELARNGTD